jgi:PAS domain-containing protein
MSGDGVFHREVFGGLIEGSTSPVARHLFAKWSDISRVRAPAYGDFLPDSNPRVTDNLMVLAGTEGGDFVYVSMGEASMRLVGRDLTGKSVSCVDGAVIRYVESIYRRARDEFKPAHCIFSANFREVVDLWERIVLPVQASAASGPTFLLLHSEPVNFRADMFERALETIDNAIICTRPTVDGSGDIADAWIAFANRAARKLFGITDRPDQLARSLPFLFSEADVWSKLTAPRPQEPRTILHKHPATQADYMVSSRLAGDHLIFSITAMGANEGDLVWV